MEQSTQLGFPSQEQSRQEAREDAVNVVLADMQRFLPAEIEPMTLSAMRDYMVTRLGQFQTFDNLLLRKASIEALVRDATNRLDNLNSHAQAMLTEFSSGGPAEEAFAQKYAFSPESFQRVLRHNAALEARMVVYDSEFMTLRTLNQSLTQSLEEHKDILRITAKQREQARRMLQEGNERALQMIQQRDHELEEERERTKRVVERVEAERDRANRTANYLSPQLHDLESRLRQTERLYQRSTGTDTGLGTNQQKDRDSRQDLKRTVGSRSGSKFAELFERLAVKESENAGNATEDKAAIKSGDASVKEPVTPPKVIPCVPLLPLEPVMRASSLKEREHDAAKVAIKAETLLQETVSIYESVSETRLTDDEKQNSACE